MSLQFRILLSLAALACALGAEAAVIAPRSLYEGEVAVDRPSAAARDALLEQALGQVLVRITGDRNILQDKRGQDLQKMAVRLVQQFGYERRPAPPPTATAPGSAPVSVALPPVTPPPREIQVFRARFDAAALNSHVRAAGLRVWGKERPSTVIWLAVEGGGTRLLLDAENVSAQAPGLLQAALERGVPIILPDPPRGTGPDVLEVIQGSSGRLLAASRGYGGSHYAVARITQVGPQWQGSWSLVEEGRPEQGWQVGAAGLQEALAAGMHQLADAYASRFSVVAPSGGSRLQARLAVAGVNSLAEHSRITRYLASLSTLTAVSLVEVTGDTAWYQITVQGDRGTLEQAIALGSVLAPDPAATVLPGEAVFRYRVGAGGPP